MNLDFCPNKASKEFKEMSSVFGEDKAYFLWIRNNGNHLEKAPNGANSKLFDDFLKHFNGDRKEALRAKAKIYKNEFINWFGDWIDVAKFKNSTVIWAHPASGKTYLFSKGRKDIIDFDSEYKVRINKIMGLPEGANAKELRKAARKERKQEYHDLIMQLFDEAVAEAKRTGRKLLVSDMMLLRERESDIDVITNMSDAKFIERSAMRGETNTEDKMLWKNDINDAMLNVLDKSKIINTEDFISDDLDGSTVSKVVDENGEPMMVYHGSDSYGFTIFDPSKSDDKRSLFFSDSKFIASTYTDFEPLRNSLIRKRLIDKNAVSIIRNKDWDTLKRLIEETIDYSLPMPGRERNYDPRYNYYIDEQIAKLREELNNPKLSEEESLGIQADIEKLEDSMWFSHNYSVKIREIKGFRQKEPKIIIKIDDRLKKDLESGHFIEKGIVFEGTPEQLIDAIQIETKIYNLFLNIKNPLILDNLEGEFGASNNWNEVVYKGSVYKTREISDIARKEGYDGVLFRDIIDHGGYKGDSDLNPTTDQSIAYDYFHEGEDSYTGNNIYSSNILIAYSPNQIKSATDNNGEFSKKNDNIYKSLSDYNKKQLERQRFADYIERLNKWLADTYPNYNRLSDEDRKKIKDNLLRWFNQQNFKFFKPVFHYDKDSYVLYGVYGDSADRNVSDVKQLCDILGTDILDNNPITPSNETLEQLITSLFLSSRNVSKHVEDICELLKDVLKDSKISILFVNNLPNGISAQYDYFSNTVKISRFAAFRNDNDYNNTLAQTVMHELLHAATVNAVKHSAELRRELLSLLDKVKKSAAVKYRNAENEYGLTDIYEFLAELSNEKFVDLLRNIHTGSTRKSLLSQVIDFLHKAINKILNRVNKYDSGTAYADAMELLLKASFPKEFNVTLEEDIDDGETIFNSISATAAQLDDEYNKISSQIRELFQTLYKKFDKMPNKSTTRRNTQTNIFKTISELKSQLADLAITTALRSAIEQLGLMDDQDASPQSLNTLYAWFVNQEGKLIPYENATPEQLQDIYKHLIGFYRSMLAMIPNRESTLLNENQRQLRSAVESQLNVIENMWKHAVELIGEREIDKMIDKFTGLAIPQEQKENMKKVYRDWLHKNWFYGDITSFTSLFTSYGQSSNPIVRIAFHLTQYAEQKTQEELLEEAVPLARQFQKVSTLSSWVKPGWLKIFQEKNRDGVPTGYWVRPINYGQYELDKNEFVLKLNDEFDNKYGFHYIDDDLGMVKNSVTGVYIEDDANEQWNGNTPPSYIEYMLKLIKWKCDHANMRYTYEYYSERLSRPYDPVHYPQGHGLSLKALNAYNAVQSRINYYLDLCRDKDGVSRPELPKDMGGLTDAERQELDKAKLDLEELSSPFEENGTVKVDDDYQIAMEILTWQNFINNEVDNDNIDYSQFKLAEDEAIRLSNEKNDPSILVNFYRYNTVTKIDPSFIKAIFGVSRNLSSADIIVKQILTKCMENLTKIKDNVYTRDIEPFVNNTQFWVSYQKMVQDAKDGAVYDRIEDPTLDLNDVASYYNIVYKDGNGVMYDIWGNPATSSTPSNHLMTWYGFIINKYKEIADNNNGIIPGVEDEYGNPIIFSGTDAQVYDAIKNKLFSYEATWFDKKGMMHSEIKPLPIFLILIPNDRSLITRVPVGKWSIKDSRFTNHNFDNNQGISEQPKSLDDAGNSLYDNSEAYRKVTENKEVYKLYNMMIDSMKRMQKVMGFSNRTFNYQMPMLNADTSALLSRGDLNSLLYSVLNVQNDDTDMRNIKEGIRNADGTVSFDIPLRLLQKLDNMKMLSSDVIQSVILYALMAYNYRNKKAIQDTMLTIHDNLTPSVRKRTLTDAERFGSTPVDQSPAIDDSESLKLYEAMMDSTMYGMDTGASLKVHKEASKAQVAGRKFGSSAIRTEAVATLGLNILSMFAGGFDSMAKQLRESIMNRYMSFADLAKSYIYCLTNLPIVLANVGNPIPNCKIIAMMLLNSLSKSYTHIFDNMNHNRLVKLSNNLLMGGFSMFDYFANMVLLRAHYRNVRFYDGNVIPKGFYTAYEMRQAFKQAGKSWKEGALAHSLCKTSLWSAYEFRDGRAVVKDEWKNYVTDTVKTNIRTKSLQRSALYNGMAPDNDRARYLKTVWGKIIAAMRNWFLMVQQRNWVGSDDTSVLEVTDLVTKNISFGKTKIKTSKRVSLRTDEQSSQRMGWNFETNTPQEEIVKATIRALWKTLRIGWNAFRLKFSQVKNIKLSQVERYAVRGFIINLAMIAMLASVFIPIMNRAKQVVMPSNREEAGVTHTILNINNGDLISLWSADATIRAFESAYAEMDPMEVKNMVKSVSALMGAVDNQTSLVQAVPEALGYSDHTLEEMISSAGKYKYYTRGERYAYKAVGPVNNIITAFTIQGAKYNLQYYTNNYGDFFRVYGYDFKSQKKDKKSNSGILRPKIERPTIQRPLIQRPKIQRP